MIGTVGLQGLEIECIVGIYEHERIAPQKLLLDVEVDRDFAPAASSDHVSDTVDYDHLATALTELARARQYQLIETFAEEGAALLLEQDPGALVVRLEIRKPAAVPAAACSFVRVERRR